MVLEVAVWYDFLIFCPLGWYGLASFLGLMSGVWILGSPLFIGLCFFTGCYLRRPLMSFVR